MMWMCLKEFLAPCGSLMRAWQALKLTLFDKLPCQQTLASHHSMHTDILLKRPLPKQYSMMAGYFPAGAFSLSGQLPPVPENVKLVKGLFNETLPTHLEYQAAFGMRKAPISYLHIDCDLYSSSIQALKILSNAGKLRIGTVVLFDDLVRSCWSLHLHLQ